MKISSWNINSVNARLEHLLSWLKEENPDIALLQELKCVEEAFPHEPIEDLGYNIAINGQKTYNGVAILSKYPLSDIIRTFPNNPISNEARYIEAMVNIGSSAFKIASVYVPNGQDLTSTKYKIKLEFLSALESYYKSLLIPEEKIIIAGDFNVALSEIDVYYSLPNDSICFSLDEKKSLRKLTSIGLHDCFRILNPTESGYTWWDYRANSFNKNNGMRIDYIFCSSDAMQNVTQCFAAKYLRGLTKASDHIPVSIIFNQAP